MLDHARAILAAQPFSTLLGTELTRYEVGITEMQLDLSDKIKQQLGFVHGGVLAYLADISMTFAGGSVLQNVLTSEIKINYLRPATGDRLIARADVLSHGRRQAVCRCEIFVLRDGEEVLCAAGQGTIVKIADPS